MNPVEFKYTEIRSFPGGMPFLSIDLVHKRHRRLSMVGLVDSGAALNILPLDVGLELGLDWSAQSHRLEVGGTLKGAAAYAVLLEACIAEFPPVELGFAWVNKRSSEIPILLGQVNFFQMFNVCFYGHRQIFEVVPRPNWCPNENPKISS